MFYKEDRDCIRVVLVIVDGFSRMSVDIVLLDLIMWMLFGDLIKNFFRGEVRMMWVVECEEKY